MYKKLLLLMFLLLGGLLAGCQANAFGGGSLFNESGAITESDLQVNESKQETINQLETDSNTDIEALISNHFPFVDTVSGEQATANVYGTLQFGVEELATLLNDIQPATEVSDYKEGQQILIYQDQFVTLKESEEVEDATLVEVASEQFVRNNYAPSFLTTYFTIRMLDGLFGNNWVTDRHNYCRNNGCYGGYSSTASYDNVTTNRKRGTGSYRGGGPGVGK